MLLKRNITFVAFLLITISVAQSQVRRGINNNYFVQKNIGLFYHTGSLLPHDKKLDSLKKGLISAFEIDLCLGTNGRKYWQNYYHYPSYGFSYMYTDFNYQNVLGTALSISPYLKFNLVNTYGFLIRFKVSPGIALLDKKYDSLQNKQNIAISTHLNIFINLGIQANIRLANRLFFTFGVNALHYSNGSYKKPNYGLNFLTLNTGINLNLNVYQKIPPYFKYQKKEKDRWLVTVAGAIKETGDPGGPKYEVFSLSTEYNMPFKKLMRYGGSFDIMYDNSTLVHFKKDSVSYTYNAEATKIGAAFQGEILLDRLSAFGGIGIYIYNRDKQVRTLYQRIGLRYRVTNFFYAHIALKTHLNFADYLELGVSYNLKAKYYKKKKSKDYKVYSL